MKTIKKYRRPNQGDQGGFTLVELIIVIAILGILAATVTLSLTKYIDKARKTTCIHNLSLLDQEIQLLGVDNLMGGGESTASADVFEEFKTFVESQGATAYYQNSYIMVRALCPSGGNIIVFVDPVDSRVTVECSKHTPSADGFYYQTVSVRNYYDSLSDAEKKKLLGDLNLSNNNTKLSNDQYQKLFAAMNGGDTLPEVPESILSKTEKNKSNKLYLHAYFLPDDNNNPGGKVLYYATKAKSITKRDSDKWNAYLVYNDVEGRWYEYVDSGNYGISTLFTGAKTYDSIMQDTQNSSLFKAVEQQ